MFNFLSQMARSFRSIPAVAPFNPAHALMESADRSAGLDSHRALELRQAASAWLRVVR